MTREMESQDNAGPALRRSWWQLLVLLSDSVTFGVSPTSASNGVEDSSLFHIWAHFSCLDSPWCYSNYRWDNSSNVVTSVSSKALNPNCSVLDSPLFSRPLPSISSTRTWSQLHVATSFTRSSPSFPGRSRRQQLTLNLTVISRQWYRVGVMNRSGGTENTRSLVRLSRSATLMTSISQKSK